jgi:predicted amidophosphoribosyltransferase
MTPAEKAKYKTGIIICGWPAKEEKPSKADRLYCEGCGEAVDKNATVCPTCAASFT